METNKMEHSFSGRMMRRLFKGTQRLMRMAHIRFGGLPAGANRHEDEPPLLVLMRESAVRGLLSIEKTIVYRLCLDLDAPADFIELDWSADAQNWTTGRYIFLGRFDTATIPMQAVEAMELAAAFGINPGQL